MKTFHFTQKIIMLLFLIFLCSIKIDALEVPRITLEELKSRLDRKADVIIIDTRGEKSFEREHIKGAISIPLSEVEARYKELPKDKDIVFYCT